MDWLLILASSCIAGVIVYLLILYKSCQKQLDASLYILGYYRVRFGVVSEQDIELMVGIDEEKIKKFMEEMEAHKERDTTPKK